MRIKDLRGAEYNPRKISDEALAGLKASLSSFGDISGAVFNRRTGNLVAGHQRVRALAEQHGDDLQIYQEGHEGRIKLPDGSHVRVNVLERFPGKADKGDSFPRAASRACARTLRGWLSHQRVLFVGMGTARAFDLDPSPLVWCRDGDIVYAVVPHPSGVNR